MTCAEAVPAKRRARTLQTEMASDDHALNLIRALSDLEDLLVAVEAGHGGLLHVPEAAVDLERRVRDSIRELAGEELRHCRLARERPSLVLEPRRLDDESAPGLDLGGHVRELESGRLEGRDLLAELLALLRVRSSEVVRALGEADAHRGDGDAAAVEDLEELPEALAAWSEKIPLRDRAVLERKLTGVGRAPAELLHR